MPAHEHAVTTWNGRLYFWSKDRTLGRNLFVERAFEKEIIGKSIQLLKSVNKLNVDDNSIVLDVGGYVGIISIGMVNNRIFNHAITYEPNPLNYKLLQKISQPTVSLNG